MTEAEAIQSWKDSAIESLEATEEFAKKWMETGRNLFNRYLGEYK